MKISEELVEKAKVLRQKGKTQEHIAFELSVSQGTVSRILRESGLGGHLMKRIKR